MCAPVGEAEDGVLRGVNLPAASIDGTPRPINMAEFTSPLKNNTSEKISERNAEININLSVAVNLLNIKN